MTLLRTVGALEFVFASMNIHVLIQVGFLGEGLAAVRNLTLEGSFTSVNPQMIEEVVPLAEVLLGVVSGSHADFVITFEDLNHSFRLWVFKRKGSIEVCANREGLVHGSQENIFRGSLSHFDCKTLGVCLEQLALFDQTFGSRSVGGD